MKSRISVWVAIVVIAVVLTHAFTIGYGSGFKSRGEAMLALQNARRYTPSHLAITYERTIGENQDFMRLEIDTTYRHISKRTFTYEVVCDREIRLYGANNESFSAEEASRCFVEGCGRKWLQQGSDRRISGYDCLLATMSLDDVSWQAWYTTSLPHCSAGAIVKDSKQGLILELSNTKGDYTLRAADISLIIG